MRILMISDVYFPRINGVSTSIQSFRHHLLNMGHQVTLIAPDYGEMTADENGILRIPARTVIVDKEDRMMKRGAIRKLLPALRQHDFDIVHVQTPFMAHYEGVHLGKELGLPVVATYHTFFEEYLYFYIPWLPKEWMRFAARSFSRQQCKQLNGLIVPSRPMQEVLTQYGIEHPMEKIPTGLDFDTAANEEPRQFRQRYSIGDDDKILLFVGRVAFEKNIRFLIDMAAELEKDYAKFKLIIAGEGAAAKALKKQAKKMGLADKILFLGYLRRDGELQACYKAADVFVFASRTETQGLVLLEAMACGTPVVSTAVMGTKDVMAGGRGGLIAQEDAREFANKVILLLEDEALYSECRQDALSYVEQWSPKAMAEKLVDFYQHVIHQTEPSNSSHSLQSAKIKIPPR